MDIILCECLLSGRCVAIEGEHTDINTGFIRCTDAHALLQHIRFYLSVPCHPYPQQHRLVLFRTDMRM